MSKREFPRLQGQRLAAPIRIVIAPTASGRKWVSSLNDKTLCISASPLVPLLIAQRFDPNSIIEMWHRHADAWALRNGPPVQFSEEPNVEDRRESRAQWATHFAARRGRMEAD